MPIAPGTRLGPYLVQESIGQGAMGVVYRAYHEQLERTGAVKVLQALSPDEETTARFRREAQAIAQMRHPNVLNVFDFGQCEGTPYMIVEYVEGGSLAGRIKRGPLDPKEALNYLRGIGSALDYAHSLGIVHRDVKPANVLVGRNDAPILADFGLAKLLQSSSIKSITGVTTGTPAYMAPEQVTGSQVGPAADRYSLAVMAFEMLSGSLPFDDAGVLEVLYAHVHREPPKPSSRNQQLSARVDAIVLRGLAKDPATRWESCEAFISALEKAMTLQSSTEVTATAIFAPPVPVASPVAVAPPAPSAAPAAVAAAAPAVIAKPVAPTEKKKRSRAVFAWLGAALILLLILGTAALLVGNRTTLQLTPSRIEAGGTMTVVAHHVPRNQVGDIQLHSVLHTYPFRANGNGDVSRDIVIPTDTPAGAHVVAICWNGSCHAQQTLQVVSGVALVTPGATPSPSTSPGASPSSTPSSKPTATSPTPRSSPTSNPTRAPSPSPSPKTSPTPPPPKPSISLSSGTIALVTGRDSVTGAHFTPNESVNIYFVQGVTNTRVSVGATTSTGVMTVKTFSIPSTALLGQATVKACDQSGLCATATVTVVAA